MWIIALAILELTETVRCVHSFAPGFYRPLYSFICTTSITPPPRDRLQALTSSLIRSLLVITGFFVFPVLIDDLSPLIFMKVRPSLSSFACECPRVWACGRSCVHASVFLFFVFVFYFSCRKVRGVTRPDDGFSYRNYGTRLSQKLEKQRPRQKGEGHFFLFLSPK